MTTHHAIVSHYTSGSLFDRIMEGLHRMGKDADAVAAEDLKAVDEFHIGGVQATNELLDQLAIGPAARVLDIGSGIGGPARHIAGRYGALVTGIDLTPEFVETAERLTAMTGVTAGFQVASALDLPFGEAAFDVATLLHVGMNLPDKVRLFAEAFRVLEPGGYFAVYDIMQMGVAHPAFPVPWASAADGSFLASPEAYRSAATEAGFTLAAERERGDFARAFFAKMAETMAKSGPPPLALPVVMGAEAPAKIGNMVKSLNAGDIAPVEMIFCKPGGHKFLRPLLQGKA